MHCGSADQPQSEASVRLLHFRRCTLATLLPCCTTKMLRDLVRRVKRLTSCLSSRPLQPQPLEHWRCHPALLAPPLQVPSTWTLCYVLRIFSCFFSVILCQSYKRIFRPQSCGWHLMPCSLVHAGPSPPASATCTVIAIGYTEAKNQELTVSAGVHLRRPSLPEVCWPCHALQYNPACLAIAHRSNAFWNATP
jgi:hypothetical protein